MASIRLPTASSMLTTRSSIQRRLISSVKASRIPVTKFLMAPTKSNISFGIWATMPMMLPRPLDSKPSMPLPMLPSVLPMVLLSVVPIVFAMPSPIWGRILSSVPFNWSMPWAAFWTLPKPSAPDQPLALLRAVVNPLVKLVTSSLVRFNAPPKASMSSRACAVASPSSWARCSNALYSSAVISPASRRFFPSSRARTAASSSFFALS